MLIMCTFTFSIHTIDGVGVARFRNVTEAEVNCFRFRSDTEDISCSKPQEQLHCLQLPMMLLQLCHFIYFNHIALLLMDVFCGNSPVRSLEVAFNRNCLRRIWSLPLQTHAHWNPSFLCRLAKCLAAQAHLCVLCSEILQSTLLQVLTLYKEHAEKECIRMKTNIVQASFVHF